LNQLEGAGDKLEFLNEFGDGEVCQSNPGKEYGEICRDVDDCRLISINYGAGHIEKAELHI